MYKINLPFSLLVQKLLHSRKLMLLFFSRISQITKVSPKKKYFPNICSVSVSFSSLSPDHVLKYYFLSVSCFKYFFLCVHFQFSAFKFILFLFYALDMVISRPGRNQRLLYKHLCDSFNHLFILNVMGCENIFLAAPHPNGSRWGFLS